LAKSDKNLRQVDAMIHEPITIEFDNNRLLPELYGEHGKNLVRIEQALGVSIANRGNQVFVSGDAAARARAELVLNTLYHQLETGGQIGGGDVDGAVRLSLGGVAADDAPADQPRRLDKLDSLRTNRREVVARSTTQAAYIKALLTSELVVGTGPAGTGKTYLAVAAAAAMLVEGRVDRIILSRPAVEAGESLGFLPGDMRDKVDPYLRPLYDALYDMLPGPQVTRSLESGEIEIAPLAFMRGRTLSNAFVILDEAQNATPMQMKMFLTRMGENSRMVITGDPSQVDLPFGAKSGLKDALEILPKIRGVDIIQFGEEDVVRHDLVTRIVKAYNKRDATLPQRTAGKSSRKRAAEPKNPSLLDDAKHNDDADNADQENEQK
jgi:phosphate starvation-inducible PhoH-like protein